MTILSGFLLVLFIISAVLLVVLVLMQDEQGEGLGGIFGGGGAAPVGNRSGNILTKATSVLAAVFLISLFGYAWVNRTPEQSNVEAAARALEAERGDVLEWWKVRDDDLDTDRDRDGVAPEASFGEPIGDDAANDENTDQAGD